MNTGIVIKGSDNKSVRKKYMAMHDNISAMEALANSMGKLAEALGEQAKAFQSQEVGYITISNCMIGDSVQEQKKPVEEVKKEG